MNREIILINGALADRSEWLGDQLAAEQYSQLFVEHISVARITRALGRTTLKSLNNIALYDAVSESLSNHNNTGLVLVSNYPQHLSQIDDIYELALHDGRQIAGIVVQDSLQSDAIMHIIEEHPQPLTVDAAKNMLLTYHQDLDPMLLELRYRDLPFQFVDMSKAAEKVIHDGVHSIKYLLTTDGLEGKHAS